MVITSEWNKKKDDKDIIVFTLLDIVLSNSSLQSKCYKAVDYYRYILEQ